MSEWQPIETAPKDGTTILIYGGTYFHDNDGSWNADDSQLKHVTTAYFRRDGWCMGFGESYNDEIWAKPTHWMPLPTPPTQPQTGE